MIYYVSIISLLSIITDIICDIDELPGVLRVMRLSDYVPVSRVDC